ncbi:MAG: hypothetical protein K2X38_14765 [Gemmataceae bacterium]|nr:hypothetical protein [Gemmataceae bacterium]
MHSDAPPFTGPSTLDLTGLPAQTVRQILKIAQDARAKSEQSSLSPNQNDPERWSAELRAWINSFPARDIVVDTDRESIYSDRQ